MVKGVNQSKSSYADGASVTSASLCDGVASAECRVLSPVRPGYIEPCNKKAVFAPPKVRGKITPGHTLFKPQASTSRSDRFISLTQPKKQIRYPKMKKW